MNDEFKYERELHNPPKEDSDAVSSDNDNEQDFQAEVDNLSSSDINEKDFNDQSELIDKYFTNDGQLDIDEPIEIKEEENSDQSNDSAQADSDDEKFVKPDFVPNLNTKVVETKRSMDVENDSKALRLFKNNNINKQEDGEGKSIFSDKAYKHKKINPGKALNEKSSQDRINLLTQDQSNRVISENPYSDSKTRTTYAWNNENDIFQAVKGSQNLYNNSIKKK